MKIIIDAEKTSSNCFNLKDGDVTILSWCFTNIPKEAKEEEISLSKILKLKEAGFDTDEIIKMKQEGML